MFKYVLVIFFCQFYTQMLFGQVSGEKSVVLIIEGGRQKPLPIDVDPVLASLVGGLESVQKNVENAGIVNCKCAYLSHTRGRESTTLSSGRTWEAYDVHLGKYLSEDTRLDFIYINEGRPKNNHRDGFAMQAVYDIPVNDRLKLEFGVGPYFSMNTTSPTHNINNQIDDKHLGILGTIGALYSLDQIYPGMHLRAEYNHTTIPGTFNTDSLTVGLGQDFGTLPKRDFNSDEKNELAIIGSHYKTNHHKTHAADGFQIELKHKVTENTDLSVSYLKEGRDELVDRQGIAAQYWYSQELKNKWVISAGAGPYIAENRLTSGNDNINGLISFEFKREVAKDKTVFVRLSRIADFQGSNDRDIFGIGFSGKID